MERCFQSPFVTHLVSLLLYEGLVPCGNVQVTLLDTLMLPYGSSQPTLCIQSICKTHTPSQNNTESPSIRDHVDTLEAAAQEIRCCLKLFTAFTVYRDGA